MNKAINWIVSISGAALLIGILIFGIYGLWTGFDALYKLIAWERFQSKEGSKELPGIVFQDDKVYPGWTSYAGTCKYTSVYYRPESSAVPASMGIRDRNWIAVGDWGECETALRCNKKTAALCIPGTVVDFQLLNRKGCWSDDAKIIKIHYKQAP